MDAASNITFIILSLANSEASVFNCRSRSATKSPKIWELSFWVRRALATALLTISSSIMLMVDISPSPSTSSSSLCSPPPVRSTMRTWPALVRKVPGSQWFPRSRRTDPMHWFFPFLPGKFLAATSPWPCREWCWSCWRMTCLRGCRLWFSGKVEDPN